MEQSLKGDANAKFTWQANFVENCTVRNVSVVMSKMIIHIYLSSICLPRPDTLHVYVSKEA